MECVYYAVRPVSLSETFSFYGSMNKKVEERLERIALNIQTSINPLVEVVKQS
jgi:hypothetical protein